LSFFFVDLSFYRPGIFMFSRFFECCEFHGRGLSSRLMPPRSGKTVSMNGIGAIDVSTGAARNIFGNNGDATRRALDRAHFFHGFFLVFLLFLFRIHPLLFF